MALAKRDQIRALLKSIETGDSGPLPWSMRQGTSSTILRPTKAAKVWPPCFKRLSKTVSPG